MSPPSSHHVGVNHLISNIQKHRSLVSKTMLGAFWLTALLQTAACGAPATQTVVKASRGRPQTAKTATTGNKISISVIDRMLAERNRRDRPQLPGYKLIYEAEEATARIARIITVIRSRLRTAQTRREFGRVICLRDQLKAIERLHTRTSAETLEIERALRKTDRARAEELWLRVRVADMQGRDYIHQVCTNSMHVEVEMTKPDGSKHHSGRSPDRNAGD